MENPILRYHKKVEAGTNKIRLPKEIVEQWGKEYYLEIYADKIVLRPIKKGE